MQSPQGGGRYTSCRPWLRKTRRPPCPRLPPPNPPWCPVPQAELVLCSQRRGATPPWRSPALTPAPFLPGTRMAIRAGIARSRCSSGMEGARQGTACGTSWEHVGARCAGGLARTPALPEMGSTQRGSRRPCRGQCRERAWWGNGGARQGTHGRRRSRSRRHCTPCHPHHECRRTWRHPLEIPKFRCLAARAGCRPCRRSVQQEAGGGGVTAESQCLWQDRVVPAWACPTPCHGDPGRCGGKAAAPVVWYPPCCTAQHGMSPWGWLLAVPGLPKPRGGLYAHSPLPAPPGQSSRIPAAAGRTRRSGSRAPRRSPAGQ